MQNMTAQSSDSSNQLTDVYFPFSIHIDPMEKLLLVNFEKDPDSVYLGFEPQVFKDEENGFGHIVIGWRKDKKVDVYHQSSLRPDASKYNITGAGLNQIIAVEMEHAFFEVNNIGVQAHYKFKDAAGREVEIFIRERNPRKRKPFGLLAPMGDAASSPTSMPLVLLHDFYFVRKKDTDIRVTIDNRSHQPDELPIPMDLQKMTFVRYSPKPLIATLNPAYEGVLEALKVKSGKVEIEKGNEVYTLEWQNQKASVRSLRVRNGIYTLQMQFSPAFPCLNMIAKNSNHTGKFVISGHPSVGSISGAYHIQSANEQLSVRLTPTEGWKPKTTKFSTWFLFTVAKVFKKWPTTYQWDAKLQQTSESSWQMQSNWKRTGKILKE